MAQNIQPSEHGLLDPHGAFSRLLRDQVFEEAVASGSVDRSRKVLIVDDRAELLESLYELLDTSGFNVTKAQGGPAALELLEHDEFDVVLLDLIMPEVSGHDLLDIAVRDHIRAKIIVVSGDASFDGVKHALTCGAFGFIKKPYEPHELIATLDNALRQCDLEAKNELMEQKIKESEGLHRFLVNHSPDLVYILDKDGCFFFLNDRVESLLGYSRDELLGKHYSQLVFEEDLDTARNLFNERRSGSRAVRNVELRMKCKHGRPGVRPFQSNTLWMELAAMGVYSDPHLPTRSNFAGSFGTARDVSERKEAEQVINFQAYHDLLTHLPNRALLNDRLSVAIAQANRNQSKLGVMFLDLDRFKLVNDSLGHAMGDRLLKAVASRLQSCLRRGDTLARYGGDEFCLLLPEVRTREDVALIATKILDRLSTPFVIDGHELFVGASIGIAMYPQAGDSVDTLIQNADIAMFYIKARGKNGYQFFSEEMNQRFSTRLSVERELRSALANGELRVFYQPQVNLETGEIAGVEALVRWQHPERGLVAPEEFLPVAEETGLITQLDEWVQFHAFENVARWRREGLAELGVSVNMTPQQLEQERFVERFDNAIDASGLGARFVKLEITENTLMRDVEVIVPKLKYLRERGVRIAIDDFGTGYSSLSYLQQFPINTLKIDRTFVSDIGGGEEDASIVNAIVAMARGLKLDLIAEGVETTDQLGYLMAHGCSEGQGFLFSQALSGDDMIAVLTENPFRRVVLEQERVTA